MNRTTLTPDQAEGLIAGSVTDEGLEDLAAVIESLRTYSSVQLDKGLVDHIVMAATECVSDSAADSQLESTVRFRPIASPTRSRWRHVATVAASLTLVLAGGSAVAIAADGASPGDALYGIDRALESVGIGDGGTQERFEEVDDLIAKGDVAHGLEHAAATLTEGAGDDVASDSNHEASLALRRAAERAREAQPSEADTTKEGVASLLDYLAENIGNVDGQRVAELARGIGNGRADNPPNSQGSEPGSNSANPNSQGSEPGSNSANPNSQGSEPGSNSANPNSQGSEPGSNSANPNSQGSEPGSNSANPNSQGSNQGKAPDEPPGQSKKDSESNSNAPPGPGNSSKPKQEK